jgi:hypothetical protein
MLTRRSGLGLGATVAVILTSSHANGFAAPPDKASTLLTTAEIGAHVGTPSNGRESEVPPGRGFGNEPTKVCTWTLANGAVRATFARAGGNVDSAVKAFRARLQTITDALKAAKWTLDEKRFGENEVCWTASPPATETTSPRSTTCAGVTNGFGVSVGGTAGAAVDVDKMKRLLDAAMGRVH